MEYYSRPLKMIASWHKVVEGLAFYRESVTKFSISGYFSPNNDSDLSSEVFLISGSNTLSYLSFKFDSPQQ